MEPKPESFGEEELIARLAELPPRDTTQEQSDAIRRRAHAALALARKIELN